MLEESLYFFTLEMAKSYKADNYMEGYFVVKAING